MEQILNILKEEPDDLALSAGRSILNERYLTSLPLMINSLESNTTEDYIDIIATVFQDIEGFRIIEYVKNLPENERERVIRIINENKLIPQDGSMPALSFLA